MKKYDFEGGSDSIREMRSSPRQGEGRGLHPELGHVDPSQFGLCLHTNDGHICAFGDNDEGNSLVGMRALEMFNGRTGLSLF